MCRRQAADRAGLRRHHLSRALQAVRPHPHHLTRALQVEVRPRHLKRRVCPAHHLRGVLQVVRPHRLRGALQEHKARQKARECQRLAKG